MSSPQITVPPLLLFAQPSGPESQWRTRRTAVKGMRLHQRTEFGTQLSYLDTQHMLADSLAIPLGANKLPQVRDNLRVLDYHS